MTTKKKKSEKKRPVLTETFFDVLSLESDWRGKISRDDDQRTIGRRRTTKISRFIVTAGNPLGDNKSMARRAVVRPYAVRVNGRRAAEESACARTDRACFAEKLQKTEPGRNELPQRTTSSARRRDTTDWRRRARALDGEAVSRRPPVRSSRGEPA